MAKKLPKPTDQKRGDSTWPFPTKLLSGIPKKERRKKDMKDYEEAPL
jgi:hypothetical protein